MKLFDKNNILIIRLSSIGDVILTTPVLRAVRNKFPNSRIDFLTSLATSSLLDNSPYVNNLWKYDKAKPEQNKILKNLMLESIDFEKYDIVIDLQNNLRTLFFLRGMFKKKFSLNKNRLYKLSLIHFKKQISKSHHIVERYFDTLDELEVSPDELGCELFINNQINILPSKNESIRIGIAPGAKHYTKRWHTKHFAKLADLISKEFVAEFYLLGSSEEKSICDEIALQSNCKFNNFAGQLSLLETAKLIDELDIVISNDSAIMHIASAKQVPILAIYCSTVPELGFTPYKAKYEIMQHKISCQPCTHIGRSECPKKHFKCSLDLSPDQVFDGFKKLIEEQNKQ